MKSTILIRIILLAFFLSMNLYSLMAQDSILVKGVILSHANMPVPDVSVNIEGSSSLPVLTNEAGEFNLRAASGEEWIIIAPTGNFKRKRIFLNNREELKIYLTAGDIPSGDDQLTVLYQPVRKRNMVASYADLNTQKIQHSADLTIDQYMQGRVPGIFVVNRSGLPGSGAVTTIRGISSIHASNQPLYVVDGIPLISPGIFGSNIEGNAFNPLTWVNPFDISQTTIIKDPALSASYGSKGSNGLIIIETLDPSVTQTTIQLDLRTGYSLSPPDLIPQLDAFQHKTFISEEIFSTGAHEEDIREYFPNLYLTEEDERYIDYRHNTNWQKLIYTNSYFNNMNLIVKGGDEIARYGLSFGYLNGKGIIKKTGYEAYNLRFVSRLNIFTWFKMNAGVSLARNSSSLKEGATVKETSPILTSLAKSPLLNPYQYDVEGREITTLTEVDELGTSNPLAIINNYEAKNNNYGFISTLGFEGTINKALIVNSKFSLTYNILKEELFMPNHGMERYYDYEAINVAKSANNSLTSFYNNTYLSYSKLLGKKHKFSSNTGMNVHSNNFELDWGLTKNAHENDQYRALQDGQNDLREIGGQNRIWNWMSFYENLNYEFKDKYLLTASLSLDGSSRVGDNADNTMKIGGIPFGFFYAGGVAWRLSNELFLKNLPWLEELKLRLTAGKTGNDDIGEASALKYYQAVKFRETVGLYPGLISNDRLTYETVSQIDAGIDLSLWGNRFRTTVDIFRSTTDNMLIFTPLQAYLGYDFRIENGGKMENNGWEFNVFMRLVDASSFKWDIETNISSVKNKVLQIKGNKLITSVPGAELVNMEGSPANGFYGYIFKGVFSTQAEASSANLVNDKDIPFQAGDAIFEDISGPNGEPDHVINNYDKTVIGSSLPDYFGGFINSFSFKRWTLSAFLQFVSGNEIFNYLRFKNEQMTSLANQSQNVLNRWQYDGQETDVPRALYDDPIGNSAFSTRWIEDGSYLRIKNITLSYRIPDQFLVFRDAEFYISANNIFVFTKYLGYDPEFAYSFSQIHQGIDYGLTPQARQFIAGVRIGL